jgi:Zn-dependent protease
MLFLRNLDAITIAAVLVALVVGITFHEFSHAFVADQLGDHRPRALGRVSLNPADHIDPMGALMFVLVGFGWGKPVPVNMGALRPGRIGMSWVSAAGPLANLAVAVALAVVFRVLAIAAPSLPVAGEFLSLGVYFNLALALFNLLPIPPLDGYNFALGILPPRQAIQLQQYARYGMIALLVLVLASYTLPGGGPLGWLFDLAGFLAGILLGA